MKQILCFGDSNTYGLIPGTKDRYDWDTRWSGRIGQRLWEDGCRIVEEGLCGRTTVFDDPLRDGRRGTELLSVILETHKPVDVVVLMLGTNDCKTMYDASAEVIGRGVERLLDQIKEGEILALDNGKLSFTEKDINKATYKLVKKLSKGDANFVTLIYGVNVTEENAEQLKDYIQSKLGDKIEVMLVNGGQPIYYYIISVE